MTLLRLPVKLILTDLRFAAGADLGVWFRLVLYCRLHKTKGRIRGGRTWDDQRWKDACRVTAADVATAVAAPLLAVEGEDIVVLHYPMRKCPATQSQTNENK